MIFILDYGMGNLRSVAKAFDSLGFAASIVTDVPSSGHLVIPGVGAFRAAMERIGPLAKAIQRHTAAGQPLMGICLGQQLLFEASEEHGRCEGLGLLEGEVRYLPANRGLKVPHIGWSPTHFVRRDGLATNESNPEYFYYVHSLACHCRNPVDVAAEATYGDTFAAAVQHGHIWGTQFHPEKSGQAGLRLLRNFALCLSSPQ